jgi:bacterioferritin-associated ferredoxin
MQPDDKLCYCFHITQRKVQNFIRIHQPRVPSQISECGGAGTGCGWCVPFLRRLFDAAQTREACTIEIDADAYARQRTEYVKTTGKKPPSGAAPLSED